MNDTTRKKFIVESEIIAYRQWLDDLTPIIREYIKKGIKVHVCKGDIVGIESGKCKLTRDERFGVMNVTEKFLYCLSKIDEASKQSVKGEKA